MNTLKKLGIGLMILGTIILALKLPVSPVLPVVPNKPPVAHNIVAPIVPVPKVVPDDALMGVNPDGTSSPVRDPDGNYVHGEGCHCVSPHKPIVTPVKPVVAPVLPPHSNVIHISSLDKVLIGILALVIPGGGVLFLLINLYRKINGLPLIPF